MDWYSIGLFSGPTAITLVIILIVYKLISKWKLSRNKNSLGGKIVVITGASSGLGEAMAHTFYEAGCIVVLAARRLAELERVRTELIQKYPRSSQLTLPHVLQLDLSDLKSIPEKISQILNTFDHIDLLINNGGISVRADVASSIIDVDVKVMTVNYFGSVAMTKAVLPSMIHRKEGKIVFISSVTGKIAIPHRSAYVASKHALQSFTDSLRAELHDKNIKILVISPGFIKTAIAQNALNDLAEACQIKDSKIENGESPEKASKTILKAILSDEKDVIIVAPMLWHIVPVIRAVAPSIFFRLMVYRAKKTMLN